ncbi:isopropylmalate isomerase large subunit [Pseudooceanicola batsensis HTCC2597]|uniref:Isopropylmalate isomerase large subunit n=1 Tax=Pseudooceanicola batsensis (strain ATCC BAA-863 / DSM 15984 / KCTC 12145 / HTCC2597) TaxID=252305 RepID=A3TYJ5_PSEBH|nr:VPLPA-CTERM sorting domain-containing protein [Pseudooceanicola batsensis]EAQ03229.1 isopropylmalate isomerase large subunit [Pseudooceanicola batsensis HTCC2597]
MKFFSLLAGVSAAFLATQAGAAVVSATTEVQQGGGDVTVSPLGSTVDFSFDPGSNTPFTATAMFTSDTAFSLSLTAYDANGNNNDVSGYTLDLLDGVGDFVSRWTTDTTNCGSSVSPVSDGSGFCNLVAATGATGGQAAGAAKPGATLFANLAAGQYRLGFYDSSTPDEGTITFTYSAVPLPAGAALFLSALGGLGLLRRRKG